MVLSRCNCDMLLRLASQLDIYNLTAIIDYILIKIASLKANFRSSKSVNFFF